MESQSENKVVVLCDLENLVFDQIRLRPENFSWTSGFDKLIEWTEKIGDIVSFCVFFPSYFLYRGVIQPKDLEYFQQNNIFSIVCSKIGPDRIDTVDSSLIQWGSRLILPHLCGITHLVVGSGDKDFLWLQSEAHQRGIKLAIAFGSSVSLAGEVAKKADCDEKGERMIYQFSPTRR